jgi:hypothetical protein
VGKVKFVGAYLNLWEKLWLKARQNWMIKGE